MKKLILSIVALSFLFTLVGCGTGKVANESPISPEAPIAGSLPEQKYVDAGNLSQIENFHSKVERKIIKNANLELEVKDTDETYNSIIVKVSEIGGYVANSSKIDTGKRPKMYIEARVPSSKLTDFLSFIENLGKVKNLTTNTEEITSDYYDVKARLQNALNQKNKLSEIMTKAKTVDEILKVQKEIDLVQERIEQLQGQLKLWDNLVDFSTVRINITQDPRASAAQEGAKLNPFSFVEWWNYIKNGFIGVLNFLIIFFQWIITILIAAVIPIIIIFLLIKLFRKQKKFK